MNRPRFSFRPNLQNEDHCKAWAVLQAVPERQRNAFLVRAILQSDRQKNLEDALRQIFREELSTVSFQTKQPAEDAIPQEMLGFLGSLMGDD